MAVRDGKPQLDVQKRTESRSSKQAKKQDTIFAAALLRAKTGKQFQNEIRMITHEDPHASSQPLSTRLLPQQTIVELAVFLSTIHRLKQVLQASLHVKRWQELPYPA